MSELPELFTSRGVFVPLADPSTLDDVHRDLYEAVANACGLGAAADDALATAQAKVKALTKRRDDLERYKRDHIKPPTFMDEWNAMKAQRAADRGR